MTSSRSCTTDKGARSDLRGREALVKDIQLSRLAAAVSSPRQHTLRYAGVLGAAFKWRALVVPPPPCAVVAATEPVEVPLKGQEASDPTVGRLLRCVTTGKIQLR